MQKTIDKLSNKMNDRAVQIPYDLRLHTPKAFYDEMAKTFLEALDIVILPKDAEPIVGDTIEWKNGVGKRRSSVLSKDIDYYTLIMDCDFKITGRNGKPVIMEE